MLISALIILWPFIETNLAVLVFVISRLAMLDCRVLLQNKGYVHCGC